MILRSLLAVTPLLLLAGCATTGSKAPTDNETRFIILGDTQFANKGVFERMIHEVEMLQPDAVVQVGDLIHGYTYDPEQVRHEWRMYQAQIAPLTVPFYPVPGNHDITTPPAVEVYKEVWGDDKFYYSFDEGRVHGIILNSFEQDHLDGIGQSQFEWLVNDLETFAKKHGGKGSAELEKHSIYVFLHSPLWRYNKDTQGFKDWQPIHELLTQYPVRGVFGGHTHEYVWENRDGIDYVVLNSSGGKSQDNERGGFFHGYIHVSVRDDNRISYGVIKAGSVLPLDTVDTTERNAIPKYALRNGTIRLPEWQEGRPINTTVSVPVANRLDEPRLFRLDWHVPYGADVQVEPEGLWLEVPAKETKEVSFRISSSSAPEEEHRPWLELSSENKLRTGVVSREWEQKYRDEAESAEFPTNIELDAPITYTSKLQIFKPPVAIALPRTGDITIDGKFTEEAWFKAPPINDFRNANEAEPDVDTGIRLLYDDNFLYVAAVMEEPNPENMTNTATGDIALTWSDDDLELFFDPKMSESDYWRLFQNSFGTRFSSKPRDVENKYFDSAYESAIETGDDYWTLEMAIPWRDIDVKAAPKAGDRWGFNIGRHRQQSEPAQIQWSSMHGEGLYNPTRYGILQFQ